MGCVISSSHGTSLLAELALKEGAQDPEGLTLPEEVHMESLEQQVGALRGTSKEYVFVRQQGEGIPKMVDSLLTASANSCAKLLSDPKHLESSDHREILQEKTFTPLQKGKGATAKQTEEGNSQERVQIEKQPTSQLSSKTEGVTRPHFKTNHSPTKGPEAQPKGEKEGLRPLHKQEALLRQNLDRQEGEQKTRERSGAEGRETKHSEGKSATQHQTLDQPPHRKVERDEGFSERQHHHHQEDEEHEGPTGALPKIDETLGKALISYGAEESILSELLNMRVSQFDVLILFLEIMKLDLKNRELQKLFRREERELQIVHMQKVVANYKEQANWQLFSSIGAGILGVLSGAAPLAGYIKGDWILEKLSGWIPGLQDKKPDMVFRSFSKILYSLSEMQKSTGQIQNTFSEGHRTFDQHMSEIYKAEWDERNRTIEDLKDDWKGIENFLYQTLQMHHEAIRTLYHG